MKLQKYTKIAVCCTIPLLSFVSGNAFSAPPAPTLATPQNYLSNVSQSNVYFSWYSAGATNYRIVISQNPSFSGFVDNNGNSYCSDNTCYTTTTTSGSYYKSMSLSGQKYYWKVRANNSTGVSRWSSAWSFTTAGTPSACGGNPYMDLPFSGTYKVSQGNNASTSHYNHGSWDNTYAIDFAIPSGTAIKAPINGMIYNTYGSSGSGCLGGGKVVVLKDNISGNYIAFLHLSKISKTSGSVSKGEIIGYSGGSSGSNGVCNSYGFAPHLHIHLWNGIGSPDSHTKAFPSTFQLRVQDGSSQQCLYGSSLNDYNIVNHYWKSLLN